MTGFAKQFRAPAVIASAAKQSILSLRGEMDCFAALAMTARGDGLLRGACHRARMRDPLARNDGSPVHPAFLIDTRGEAANV
ncbi:MAG TPA: hypothetical protein VK526_13165 [Bradyrhizobium sp.]|nr:hypothetical protein [Bradyrhizobium sp.]